MSDPTSFPQTNFASGVPAESGSLEGGLAGNYQFAIGEVLSEAWDKTKGVKGTFVLAMFLYFVINAFADFLLELAGIRSGTADEANLGFAFWLGTLVHMVVVAPLTAGLWVMGARRAAGAEIRATMLFDYYGMFLPILGLTLLLYLLVVIGLALLVIPGIYLAVGYSLALLLLVDKGLGVWEALESSRKAVTHHWFGFLGLALVLILINVATIFTLFIGLIWTIPLSQISFGILYRRVFGLEPGTLAAR